MQFSCYLIVSADVERRPPAYDPDRAPSLRRGPIRLTKRRPALAANEVPIKLDVTVPDSYFYKPTLRASVELPESEAEQQPVSAEIAAGIEQAVREQTGLQVRVSLPESD